MADATVTTTRHDDSRMLPSEATVTVTRGMPAMSRRLAVLWGGMVIALIAFLLFGSLRIGAGNWIGQRMPVRTIWTRFLEYLTDQGASPALVTVVVAAAAVTLVAAAYLLWLSFSLEDQRTESHPDDPART